MKQIYLLTLTCFITARIAWCMEDGFGPIRRKRSPLTTEQPEAKKISYTSDEKTASHADFEERIKKSIDQAAFDTARRDLQDWVKFCDTNFNASTTSKIPTLWTFYKTLKSNLAQSGHKNIPGTTLKMLEKVTIACGKNPDNYK